MGSKVAESAMPATGVTVLYKAAVTRSLVAVATLSLRTGTEITFVTETLLVEIFTLGTDEFMTAKRNGHDEQ